MNFDAIWSKKNKKEEKLLEIKSLSSLFNFHNQKIENQVSNPRVNSDPLSVWLILFQGLL